MFTVPGVSFASGKTTEVLKVLIKNYCESFFY